MKKSFLIVWHCILLMIMSLPMQAQPPQYYVGGNTTSGNSFPFGNGGGTGSKVQLLYYPTDFNTMPPSGTITKVYFRAYDGSGYNGTNNYVNLEIKMGATSLTNLSTGTSTFIAPLQTVFFASSYSINFTQAQWFAPIVLQTPYTFSNAANLIVEVSVTSASLTKYVAYTSVTGTRRMWGVSGSSATVNGDGGRYDIGFDIQTGPPCPAPGTLSATGITSTTATLSWGAVSGSTGYEYVIDQNATIPYPNTPVATTNTSVSATGLTPATNYYLHVRNKCSPTNPSPWVDYQFTTLPPCKPPLGFKTTNLTPTGTDINWDPWPSALNYDYLVDQTRDDPTTSTGLKNITTTTDNVPGLTEDTWYYVHIRSNCPGNETSDWGLDSFLTPIPCRPPVIKIEHINTDHAVAHWQPVPTAKHYEYALTTSPTPPALGTKYEYTSMQASSLYDGKDYYIHVRSLCTSVGIDGISDWATASFKTWPTGVSNINGEVFGITAFPNPVKHIVTISVTGMQGTAAVTITDISGKTVRMAEVTKDKTEVDMSGLPSGMYNIRYTDQARSEVVKVNKQ